MKKKAIEKIPYLGLKKTSRKKDVKYIGVTEVKIVGHEKHLFLEVYRNNKGSKDTPAVRIVLTKKDFGTYWPEREEWTRQKVKTELYYGGLIWAERSDTRKAEKENVLQSTEDLERIKKFCKATVYNESHWWQYIYRHEDDIVITDRRNREHRKYMRRQEALADRMAHTEELPEKKILDRANKISFQNEHYMYYKKHGSWAKIACSKCGGVTDARWKNGISSESQFQIWTEEPREGSYGTCPMCGARGKYQCQGKVKGTKSKSVYLFLGQKYKENGMVMRYVEVEKKWMLGFICGDKGQEMYNACEELSGIEIARAYFEPGKKTQIDYHKHDPYRGQDFWDDCNLQGLNNISINAGQIMQETYEEMKETMFRYSALQEYAKSAGEINPIDYLERYSQTPQIEIMVKMGLDHVVEKLVKCYYGIIADQNARRPDHFLGIRKERVKQLIRKKGDIQLLEVMQMEKRHGQNWTDEQIEHLAETNLSGVQVEMATRYMTLQKLLNRIEKYAGCGYGTGCGNASERIRHTATTYTDYLSMRLTLGYDLNNTVYQQPRDLEAAHTKMVLETNKEEMDKHLKQAAEKYPEIRRAYRGLRNKYFYEDDSYLIRPARSAEEIVMEGRLLHHCVGGDTYLSKHNTGKTYILMLRYKTEPDVPYITVEIDARNPRIIQWYGNKDGKPDQENMQAWLDGWLMKLKAGTLTVYENDGYKSQEVRIRVPVAASA
ncbi:MAG: PcfJ domain-containing protein [Schaedlerella sp.]|uniref:PcfJ domain-containing protein n=1 Tax=Schaedlerella sp. TaxID=2676057 RepID=UPI0035297B41